MSDEHDYTKLKYLGRCSLCACRYIGPDDHACSCGHSSTNHAQLGMCVKNGCLDCEGFYSVREIAGCAHCLHSADNHTNEGDREEESLRQWVLEEQSLKMILQMYNTIFDTSIRDRLTALIRRAGLPKGTDPKLRRGKLHTKPSVSQVMAAWTNSMTLTFLGTGSAYPSPHRACSSMVLKFDAESWMFDCGEGTQIQLQKSKLKAGKISKVFITHLHGDHLFGLPGLLCTISQNDQRDEPVDIYGPEGIGTYLNTALGVSRTQLNFQYIVHELIPTADMYVELQEAMCNVSSEYELLAERQPAATRIESQIQDGIPVWDLGRRGSIMVKACRVAHRVPSFSFIICEDDQPGNINSKKCISLGLKPGPEYSLLKRGESVTLTNGTMIRPEDVCESAKPGRRVVINGDSSDSSEVATVTGHCNLFVHEATLEEAMKAKCVEKGHSTPAMAAKFAQLANAKFLYLTHFSQRYRSFESEASKKQQWFLDTILKEGLDAFGMNVALAKDLLCIDIKHDKIAPFIDSTDP